MPPPPPFMFLKRQSPCCTLPPSNLQPSTSCPSRFASLAVVCVIARLGIVFCQSRSGLCDFQLDDQQTDGGYRAHDQNIPMSSVNDGEQGFTLLH